MANSEHLKILKKGVEAWNKWRDENQDEKPDLSGVDLTKCEFTGANFSNTNFNKARLHLWSVYDCDFSESNLTDIAAQASYWRNARFRGAHISGDLVLSRMYVADFSGASVQGCGLIDAELRFLRLNRTNFAPYLSSTVINSWTIIASDLSGMPLHPTSAQHEYPSNVDIETLQRTASGLREHSERISAFDKFFQESGLPDEIIKVFDSWARPSSTITDGTPEEANFYSCFISYSHSDRTFAKRVHDGLTDHGIHCWLDAHEILPGDDIYDMVDQGINQWDKILLCCSQNSLNSPWVDRELDKALQKEEKLWRERGRKVLAIIPLDLDGFLFEWNSGKSSMLKSRLAADFKDWQNDSAKFEGQLNKIVRSLRADEGARIKAPEAKL